MSRTIVVTGGGTGIGRAIAIGFSKAGDDVVIIGRRADVLERTAASIGSGAAWVVCDASNPDQVATLGEQLPAAVDVLVNNAGGNREFAAAPEPGLASLSVHWRANLDANLMSAVLTTTAIEDRLRPGGTVIHLGSFATDRGAGSYGAAKAALNAWNITLARRLGARDITANVVSPGYIDDTEFFGNRADAAFREARTAETMTGRRGTPQDIASMVEFLASPGARHITGQVIHVNGGALTTR
jgi:3-oxoacyl-[acyl-carrier protein] reductase